MRTSWPLTLFGLIFLIIGAVALLEVITMWNLEHIFAWRSFAYVGINFLISYGFFNAERWIVPALFLNWLAIATLDAVKLFMHTGETLMGILAVVVFITNGSIAFAAFEMRKHLHETPQSVYISSAFLLLWLGMFCYTAVISFT